MKQTMLGVDIGTTSTKAVLFGLDGAVLAQHAVEYPLLSTEPDMAEQDPLVIFDAVCTSIAGAVKGSDPAALQVVSFSAAMHSLIALDADNQLLTNSITWADNRAAVRATEVKRADAGNALYQRTGTPIHPMSPLCKLVWLRKDRPAIFNAATRFAGIKEYVFFRLFGSWTVDHSIASATGLFNLRKLDWDDGALDVAGVRREQLSTLVPTTQRMPALPAALAARLGLRADTPFVIGANDGVLSNLGLDAIAPGRVAITIGTSGAIRTVVDQPQTDPQGRTFCYALTQNHWVVGGPVNNGGKVLEWFRDEVAGVGAADGHADTYQALMEQAKGISPGAEGLLFHPFLAGERAPLWNADLRGSFFGLGLHHNRRHMVRAVLEGVLMNLYSILPAVEELVGPSQRLMASGGFARSPLWRQMLADIFDREVMLPESVESSCLGAAVLGLFALGQIDTLDAVSAMVGVTHRYTPDAGNAAIYAQLRPIFAAIPKKLEQEYALLAQFQRQHGRSVADPDLIA